RAGGGERKKGCGKKETEGEQCDGCQTLQPPFLQSIAGTAEMPNPPQRNFIAQRSCVGRIRSVCHCGSPVRPATRKARRVRSVAQSRRVPCNRCDKPVGSRSHNRHPRRDAGCRCTGGKRTRPTKGTTGKSRSVKP